MNAGHRHVIPVVLTADMMAAFAEYSGDWNPGHMDAAFARRSVAGGRVVHGVLLVLSAMERVCCDLSSRQLVAVKAEFRQPLVLGDDGLANCEVEIIVGENFGDLSFLEFRYRVSSEAGIHVEGEFRVANIEQVIEDCISRDENSTCSDYSRIAADVAIASLEVGMNYSRAIPVSRDIPTCLSQAFPTLASAHFVIPFATVAAISAMAGMHIPGKWCVLASFEIFFAQREIDSPIIPSESNSILQATLRRVSNAARMVIVDIAAHSQSTQNPFATGHFAAIVAAPPPRVTQEMVVSALKNERSDIQQTTSAFAGLSVLVTGGSRGIGELLARALHELGAVVSVTYSGVSWPQIAEDLSWPGARVIVWNIGSDLDIAPRIIPSFDIIIHCAAPRIKRDTSQESITHSDAWNSARSKSIRHFAEPIETLANNLSQHTNSGASFVALSSVFVESYEKGFEHYSAAKLDMENRLRVLSTKTAANSRPPQFHNTLALRLPQFASDQTRDASGRSKGVDPLKLILPMLEAIAESRGHKGHRVITLGSGPLGRR